MRRPPKPAGEVSDSAPPAAHDPLVSASASTAVGGGSPAHGGGRESPTPLSNGAAPSSHTSANRSRKTRYTNDQSKQPSLDHGNGAPNLPSRTPQRAAERVCEPYGALRHCRRCSVNAALRNRATCQRTSIKRYARANGAVGGASARDLPADAVRCTSECRGDISWPEDELADAVAGRVGLEARRRDRNRTR